MSQKMMICYSYDLTYRHIAYNLISSFLTERTIEAATQTSNLIEKAFAIRPNEKQPSPNDVNRHIDIVGL